MKTLSIGLVTTLTFFFLALPFSPFFPSQALAQYTPPTQGAGSGRPGSSTGTGTR